MNDLSALDVLKEIDPSLLELKSEKKAADKPSTAVIFMKLVFVFLISLMFLVFLNLYQLNPDLTLCIVRVTLTLQRGVTGTARMLHALTHSSISRQVREQM